MQAASGLSSNRRAVYTLAPRKLRVDVRCSAFLKVLKGLVGSGQDVVKSQPVLDSDVSFVEWLHIHSVDTSKVAIQTCGNEGRGLVARTRIKQGEAVLHVPRQLFIDADVAVSESLILKTAEDTSAGLSEWSCIALFLAELKWRCQQCQSHKQQTTGDQSSTQMIPADAAAAKWQQYLEVLPENPGTILSWTDSEVKKLLIGSTLQRSAATLLSAAQATWNELRPVVQQAEQAGVVPTGAVSQPHVIWALEIMLSRLVRLSSRGDSQALVPWADFANHSPSSAAHLDWTQGNGGGVQLVVDRDYAAGEQIYISYGERSCGELLLSYGFSPSSPSTHPHEAAMLRVGLQDNDPLKAEKAALLEKRGLPQYIEFPIRMNALPTGLLPWAAFCALRDLGTTKDKQAGKQRNQATSGHGDDNLSALVQSTIPGLLQQQQSGGDVRGVSEMDAYSIISGLTARALPAELQATGYKEIARCCNSAVKGLQASMPPAGQSSASSSQAPSRADMVAAIKAHELRILARAEFLARNEAKALSGSKLK